MRKYVIVVETGSDIPAEIAERYGIYTVPMHVAFGDQTRDDRTFPPEDIYQFFTTTGKLTKTSGCTVEDFNRIFDRIQAENPGSHILHLAYSAVTTCSYQSAVIASENRTGITSFDTCHVSAGQTLVALQVARYLEKNPDASLEEVIAQAEAAREKCRMGFFPGDLAYLRAGGRVSNAAYLGAKLLSLNPLIEVLGGKLTATKKYRGKMDAVAPKFLREYVEQNHLKRDLLVFVYSKGLKDSIRENVEVIAKDMGFQEILWVQTGGVVTTHCGPGGFGVGGFAE